MTDHKIPLAADGALVLPADLRAELGWQPGDCLTVECDGDRLLVRRCEATEDTEAALTELRRTRERFQAESGTAPDSLIGIRAERDGR